MATVYKILLVDDEINSLKVLSAALTAENILVETAASGEEAYAMFRDESYDLVISDYKMPGMNGEELLEKVKTITPEIPFILLTAFGSIELAVNAMRKGAYTYLTKPVNLDLMETGFQKLVNDDNVSLPYGFLEKPIQIPKLMGLMEKLKKVKVNL